MGESRNRYFIVNKPFDMLSQFIGQPDAKKLCDLPFDFPADIHAVGRLDKQSEGLLILTTNKKITRLLFQGKKPHRRTYLVKVKDKVGEEGLNRLRTGVRIRIAGGVDYITEPCEVDIVEEPANLWDRPFELNKSVPHTWLKITLTQGKYHQVRKMVSGIGHRCQRLLRVAIDELHLGTLPPAGLLELSEEDFFRSLHLETPADPSPGADNKHR